MWIGIQDIVTYPGKARINGFRIRWIDLLDIHRAETQLVVTQSYCNYNTS
jgi:hypothetical protein